jgi:hypothetical protein
MDPVLLRAGGRFRVHGANPPINIANMAKGGGRKLQIMLYNELVLNLPVATAGDLIGFVTRRGAYK